MLKPLPTATFLQTRRSHHRVRLAVSAFAVTLAWTLVSGCGGADTEGLVCPLLAPGAISPADIGSSLKPFGGNGAGSGELATGRLAFHSIWVPEGSEVTATVTADGERALVMGYGPRDLQGGIPGCNELRLAESPDVAAVVTFDARAEGAGGEYVVAIGLRPGDRTVGAAAVSYTVTASCKTGCAEAGAICPTLSEQGCPTVRCDGELRRDSSGCPTCECDSGALCAPGATAGPWRTCVQPGCRCPEAVADSEVCGSDGQTHPDACHALCAGAAVARDAACEDVCPAVTQCDKPCFGPRAMDADGCPTCGCAPALPVAPADCACEPVSEPVCGGDGVTYRNRCEARCAGATLLYAAACVEGCREAPDNCTLDCDWGLVLSESTDVCLQCACAAPPPASCVTSGEPLCADFAALTTPTTVGSECLAAALGATAAVWGSCGRSCGSDADCATTVLPSRCSLLGDLAGRCIVESDEQVCECSGLVEPVCGSNGETFANACFAACAAVSVAHLGECCGTAPSCDGGEVAVLDKRGCPTGGCAPRGPGAGVCRSEPPQIFACSPDGAELSTTVCESHLEGVVAAREFCGGGAQ